VADSLPVFSRRNIGHSAEIETVAVLQDAIDKSQFLKLGITEICPHGQNSQHLQNTVTF